MSFFISIILPLILPLAGTADVLNPMGLGTFAMTWNGRTPPAALVRFAGQSLDSKAYVLGCGHCNGMPVGNFVSDQKIDRSAYINDALGKVKRLPVTRIVFGTQTIVDLILVELSMTYREIEEAFNITSRLIADEHQGVGTPISFYNLEFTQYCQIDELRDRYVFDDQGTDYLLNPYIYYDCVSNEGHSGSILISRLTNQVIGLNVGGTFPDQQNGHFINYGSEISILSTCLDSKAQFDISAPACKLRF